MQSDELKRRISAGRGDALADLVLRNARIVNVFTIKTVAEGAVVPGAALLKLEANK